MLLSKQKRAYRSFTDPLPRTIPISPLHRDSITYPLPARGNQRRAPMRSVTPDTAGSLRHNLEPGIPLRPNTLQLPPLRETVPSPDGANEAHYSEWMAPYCGNPFTDVDNTCMGLWATCALYGKTHWRLQQIVADKNPQDEAWNGRNGFNSACWAQWGSSFFLMEPLGGVLVGIQRSQIRGTYGIDGHIAQDMMLGVCLPKCTQMQNDREVRAREGKIELRKSQGYNVFRKASKGTINQQPRPNLPMRYTPIESNQPESRSRQSERLSKKKSNTIDLSSMTSNENHTSSTKEQPTYGGLQPTRSFRVLRKDERQENSTRSTPSKLAKGEYDGANSIVLATYVQDDRLSESVRDQGKMSLNHKQNYRGSYLAGVPEERSAAGLTASLSEVSTRRNSHSKASINRHFHAPSSNGRNSFSFALPDCDTIIGTADGIMVRHSQARGQKDTSFVHDFTESQINKAILEHCAGEKRQSNGKHLETAEDDSKTEPNQHEVRKYTKVVSGKGKLQQNLDDRVSDHSTPETLQTPLSDCTSLLSSPETTNPQHAHENCTSVTPSPGATTHQQDPSSVTPVLSLVEITTVGHSFEDCNSMASSRTDNHQNNRSNCSDCDSTTLATSTCEYESSSSKKETLSEQTASGQRSYSYSAAANNKIIIDNTRLHPLGDCDTNLVSRKASLAQHSLGGCDIDLASRKVSLAQHTLSDCNLDLTSRNASLVQHTLSNCDVEFNARKNSLYEHTLADCDAELSTNKSYVAQHSAENDMLVMCPQRTTISDDGFDGDIRNISKGRKSHENTLEDSAVLLETLSDTDSGSVADELKTKSKTEHMLVSCPVKECSSTSDTGQQTLADFAFPLSLEAPENSPHSLHDCPSGDEPNEHTVTYRTPRSMSESDSGSRRTSSLGSSASHQTSSSNSSQVPHSRERRFVSSPSLPTSSRHAMSREDDAKHQWSIPEGSKDLVSKTDGVKNDRKKREQQLAIRNRGISPVPSETSATPSMAQQFLAQILAQNQSKMRKAQLNGANDLSFDDLQFES